MRACVRVCVGIAVSSIIASLAATVLCRRLIVLIRSFSISSPSPLSLSTQFVLPFTRSQCPQWTSLVFAVNTVCAANNLVLRVSPLVSAVYVANNAVQMRRRKLVFPCCQHRVCVVCVCVCVWVCMCVCV